jgi:hypothetical protein
VFTNIAWIEMQGAPPDDLAVGFLGYAQTGTMPKSRLATRYGDRFRFPRWDATLPNQDGQTSTDGKASHAGHRKINKNKGILNAGSLIGNGHQAA